MSDYISRQAAIKAIHDEFDECLVWDESGECTANEVERVLDGLPTIEPKRGKWVAIGNTELAACECGYITDRYGIYNYCPNCGAQMERSEDEAD